MTHGIAGYWERFAEAVWEAAVTAGDWPALYAPRTLESLDYPYPSSQRPFPGEVARLAYVRSGPEYRRDYARYEPESPAAFARLCGWCATSPQPAVVVSGDVSEADASTVLNAAVDLFRPLVERSIAAKKFRPVLERVAIPPRWAYLVGVCYEDPVTFMLAADPALPAAVRALIPADDERTVREMW